MVIPSLQDIEDAHKRIKPFIHRTPVLSSEQLNRLSQSDLYFKCENFQKVGAFKFRGATNAVLCLDDAARAAGVVTHSSGNHAAALSHAAVSRGVKAYIVMPENAPLVKKSAVNGYGARVTYCRPTLQDREDTAREIVESTGASLIHAYDNFDIICGQGTAAYELMEEVSGLDVVIAPVGGGGLISGTATAVKGLNPRTRVVGAEPEMADDAYRSLKRGALIPSKDPQTIADGLLTSLSDLTFRIIWDKVDEIITVSERSITEAMLLIWERMKIIIEPSSATVLAAVLDSSPRFAGKKVGLILSGGNVDFSRLPF